MRHLAGEADALPDGSTAGEANGLRDGVSGRPGSRTEIYAPLNTSFSVQDFIDIYGEREPAAPAFSPHSKYANAIAHAPIVWLDRSYTEAEWTFQTLWFRHMEDDGVGHYNPTAFSDRRDIHQDPRETTAMPDVASGWGGDGWHRGFLSWNASTRGHGKPQPPSASRLPPPPPSPRTPPSDRPHPPLPPPPPISSPSPPRSLTPPLTLILDLGSAR